MKRKASFYVRNRTYDNACLQCVIVKIIFFNNAQQ